MLFNLGLGLNLGMPPFILPVSSGSDGGITDGFIFRPATGFEYCSYVAMNFATQTFDDQSGYHFVDGDPATSINGNHNGASINGRGISDKAGKSGYLLGGGFAGSSAWNLNVGKFSLTSKVSSGIGLIAGSARYMGLNVEGDIAGYGGWSKTSTGSYWLAPFDKVSYASDSLSTVGITPDSNEYTQALSSASHGVMLGGWQSYDIVSKISFASDAKFSVGLNTYGLRFTFGMPVLFSKTLGSGYLKDARYGVFYKYLFASDTFSQASAAMDNQNVASGLNDDKNNRGFWISKSSDSANSQILDMSADTISNFASFVNASGYFSQGDNQNLD